tara:strand:- start:8724 stop:9584 length:861 start_codon:yes stop_codon:yes gene_type:complete
MLSKLILGTVQFGLDYGINNISGLPSLEKVFSILNSAKGECSCLDTASGYGVSEERIGLYHLKHPDKIFDVNTKFSKGVIDNPLKEIEIALLKLNIPIINTMMFHSLDDFSLNQEKMKNLLKEGKGNYFKKFGVSVYTVEELEKLKNIDQIEVVQVSFNLLDNHTKKGAILSELKALGKEIHVRSCFLQGLFFKSNNDLQENLKCAIKYLDDLNHIAKTNNYSMGELALSYCISKPYIDKVIIGVDSKDQLQQNLKWASLTLNEEVERTIDCIDIKEEVLLNPSKW